MAVVTTGPPDEDLPRQLRAPARRRHAQPVAAQEPAAARHVILHQPGFKERLYLLRYRRGNVMIEIGPEGKTLPEYLDEVRPILRSLRFATD